MTEESKTSAFLAWAAANGVTVLYAPMPTVMPSDLFGPVQHYVSDITVEPEAMHTYLLGPPGTGRGFAARSLRPLPPPPDPCTFKPMLVPR